MKELSKYLVYAFTGLLFFLPSGEENGSNFNEINKNESKSSSPFSTSDYLTDYQLEEVSLPEGNGVISYPAKQPEGLIGKSETKPVDSPSDNVFHVEMNANPKTIAKAWLVYELNGAKDFLSIPRSINDQVSTGGRVFEPAKGWNLQKEELNPDWLLNGKNLIRFASPKGLEVNYSIRNVKIYTEQLSTGEVAKKSLIINNSSLGTYYEDEAYIKGFFTGKTEASKVYVDGKEIPHLNGEFEAFIPKPLTDCDSWESQVKVVYGEGMNKERFILFETSASTPFAFSKSEKLSPSVKGEFLPGQQLVLRKGDAILIAKGHELAQRTNISITRLNSTDIPALNPGMVNVTSGGDGYRFLPNGTLFLDHVSLRIGYDESKIPQGYTEKDIRSFYFNEESNSWVQVDREGIDEEYKEIISKTNHFTDYINAIAKTPESPESQSYNPTSIKDIKAASPLLGYGVMAPPAPNNTGGANVSYPIQVPSGRQGLTPSVALQYTNEGGNSWASLGWNVSIPSIDIETRWGAPRYNSAFETETYLISGMQLTPVAHRNALQNRTSEKRFYPRIEGGFRKIIRHGNSPKNYWWEVTDKDGTRHFYGGKPGQGALEGATLKDAFGNIGHWALTETRDLNNNFIAYNYDKVQDKGVVNGTVNGYQLYIDEIRYTGHGNTQGVYSIKFTRDRDLGEPKRKDVTISARLGFKRVTADLLRKVEVKLQGQNIRSYELKYQEGAFHKTLLKELLEFDAAGNQYNAHDFEYFDDIRSGANYIPFKPAENWTPGNEGIDGGFFNPLSNFHDKPSLLGSGKSQNFGFALALTFGLNDGNATCKSLTIGGDFGYSQSKSEGMVALVDINGDALPDKVFVDGGTMMYRKNQSGPDGTTVFSAPMPITGRNQYHKEKSKTKSGGFQGHGGCEGVSAFVGLSKAKTKSTTTIYFSDVNGDQLLDIIADGGVFFNHLDGNGNPSFTLSSADTPSPISQTGGLDPDLVEIDPQELEDAIDQNPLHDIVRVWEAPHSGIISIDAPVRLVEDTSPERQAYTTADGVRVAIQHKGTELWSQNIGALDYALHIPNGLNTINVQAGDRIYFRVQSIFDGAYDQVEWAPTISYPQEDLSENDANGKPKFSYNAADDEVLSFAQVVNTPIAGQIRIEASFTKPITSDEVTLSIIRDPETNPTPVWTQTYAWDQTANAVVDLPLGVQAGDGFQFLVESPTQIDWSALDFNAELFYTSSSDPDVPNVMDSQGNPMIRFYPLPCFKMYNEELEMSQTWSYPSDTLISIIPNIQFSGAPSGDLTFSVKKELEPIEVLTIPVSGGSFSFAPALELEILADEEYFFEIHTVSPELAESITSAELDITIGNETLTTPIGVHAPSDNFIFGADYRNWGQFVYNGNRNRASLPIDESELELDPALTSGGGDLSGASDPDQLEQMYDDQGGFQPAGSNFIMMYPVSQENAWKGYDNLTYVSGSIMSSSRMGEDDLTSSSPIPTGTTGTGARGVNKIVESKTKSYSLGGGVSGGGISANGSFSRTEGETKVLSDMMDMNGDRYPDVVTNSKIQYTTALGGLEPNAVSNGLGVVHQSQNDGFGVTGGGGYCPSAPETGKPQNVKKLTFVVGGSPSSGSISGNMGFGEDEASFSWNDINGDGLPDRVYRGGQVALNLGYRFAPKENWGHVPVRDGESNSYGAGIGFNIGNLSIAGGLGVSRSDSSSEGVLQDVNGDGLLDEITRVATVSGDGVYTGSAIQVRLNKGNGFGSPITWTGATVIDKGESASESANVAFTACVLIPLPPLKICFNPSGNVGQGVSREIIAIRDINGDGFPDYLYSDKENKLTVSKSKIGRTNMLKKVNRPFNTTVSVDYQRLGNTYEMPNSVWALASVEVTDGFQGDGGDRLLSTFTYQDGYYDRHERDFYGFRTLTARQHDTQNNDAVYRSTISTFANQDYYKKGLLVREVSLDAGGNKYVETINTYALKDILTGAALPAGFEASDFAPAFPALVRTDKNFYEGQASPGETTAMTFGYDRYGNVTTYTDLGDSGSQDDLTASVSYYEITSNYIVGIPSSVIVSGGGETVRKREQSIDSSNGNISQSKQFHSAGGSSVFDFQYDAYGNIQKVSRPENHNGERLTYEYQYDATTHTYVTQVIDGYGYSSSSEYDFRFGIPIKTTSINGQDIEYSLDDIGRTTDIRGPYEIEAGVAFTIGFEYFPNAAVPYAITKHYDPEHPSNFIETVTFTDGLGRVLQVKKDVAVFTGENTPDQEKMAVSGRVIFDGLGRPIKQYYPVLENKGQETTFNGNFDNINPTETSYDILDRTLAITLPDGVVTSSEFGFGTDRFGDNQFMVRTTDGNGIVKENFSDVRGNNTSVKEFLSGNELWTGFKYNAINELIEASDDHDNKILYGYDLKGRKTSRTHPDEGLTEYSYDDADNLRTEVTANLRDDNLSINYQYDKERLTDILYPIYSKNNVRYTYGEAGAEFNRAGRIVTQEDASGIQKFFYGKLGEIEKNIRTIEIPGAQPQVFTTEWSYDTWNRLQGMAYPDGETLTYNYNHGGLLHSLSGEKEGTTYPYLTQVSYDKFEQRVFLSYGNNTKTTYSYEPDRRRLQSLTASTSEGRLMMDNSYTYDAVTNILSISNNAPVPDANQMGGPANQEFSYDELYRLTRATGSWEGSSHEHRYSLDMTYNTVHDIVTKTQSHDRKGTNSGNWVAQGQTTYDLLYEYGSPQPHAATHIGEKSYSYDKNGNNTGWNHDVSGQVREVEWDEENRVNSISDNGLTHNYTYDADGIRVLKSVGSGQQVFVNGEQQGGSNGNAGGNHTIYVNPYVVVRSGQFTKHFYIESQRITSKLGESGNGNAYDGNNTDVSGTNTGSSGSTAGNGNQGGNNGNGNSGNNAGGNSSGNGNSANSNAGGNGNGNANGNNGGGSNNGGENGGNTGGNQGGSGGNGNSIEAFLYYFHKDHLSSSSYITDVNGEVYQHLEYFAFGETFVEEHSNSNRTPYLFNSKELDQETNLYYYGARYYDPKTSRWLSVDPLADSEPSWTPYRFSYNNPINYVDPDGRKEFDDDYQGEL